MGEISKKTIDTWQIFKWFLMILVFENGFK